MRPVQLIGLIITLCVTSCQAQEDHAAQVSSPIADVAVGGPCQGCEAALEYGDQVLQPIDTLPLFNETEPKLKISGTVYQADGTTPASGVVLYIYHTNRQGIYQKQGDEQGWARNHGFIRGWVKTDKNGRYTFFTFRPGAYPNRQAPEHIHLTVKEPGLIAYYLEDYFFDDDSLLTAEFRQGLKQRGGSGVVMPKLAGDLWLVKRDLILGLNIPNYLSK